MLRWFSIAAIGGMVIMTGLSHWYRSNGHARRPAKRDLSRYPSFTAGRARMALTVLVVLIFSKYFSGLFFGLMFGVGGISAAALGSLADRSGIEFVYQLCSYLPAIGLLTVLLPNIESTARKQAA